MEKKYKKKISKLYSQRIKFYLIFVHKNKFPINVGIEHRGKQTSWESTHSIHYFMYIIREERFSISGTTEFLPLFFFFFAQFFVVKVFLIDAYIEI